MDNLNTFDICFTVLKIRYADYDRMLTSEDFLLPTDKVNIFLSLESVFKNLSMIQDLEKKLILQRGYEKVLASNIINLAGHYKRFFVNNGLDTRVYFYYTNLRSEDFPQCKYNENYRSYYNCKYTQNPKFLYLTDGLIDTVLPLVQKCCEFIPGVYLLNGVDMEGSVIPYVIAEQDAMEQVPRKNIIISSDLYDMQYGFLDGFLNTYVKRGFRNSILTCNNQEILRSIAKASKLAEEDIGSAYQTYSQFVTLLSCIGDKTRSIDGMNGIGIRTLSDLITSGISTHKIQMDTTSPNILKDLFQEDERKDFLNNFYCSSILSIFEELTRAQKASIVLQRRDRFDNQGLLQLNREVFYEHPLTLEALCI